MTTTNPTFTDETLSAFLDGELPAETLSAVRAALECDAGLAARLAMLAQVDKLVKDQAHIADSTPMPATVLALLADVSSAAAQKSATVVQGPWQRWRQPVALAASIALVASAAITYLNRASVGNEPASLPTLSAYADSLDNIASGTEVAVAGSTLLSRFSFRNQQSQYCRQYRLTNATAHSENVACRQNGSWTLVGSVKLPTQNVSDYQAASQSPELDSLLDSLMTGPALNRDAEAAVINEHWQDAGGDR